jgi:hypothetical protein
MVAVGYDDGRREEGMKNNNSCAFVGGVWSEFGRSFNMRLGHSEDLM